MKYATNDEFDAIFDEPLHSQPVKRKVRDDMVCGNCKASVEAYEEETEIRCPCCGAKIQRGEYRRSTIITTAYEKEYMKRFIPEKEK